MAAAAKHLPGDARTSGKSVLCSMVGRPENNCRRIVWGKFANAGQTRIAPDYIL